MGICKKGIWKITETLTDINLALGVKIYLNSSIAEVDTFSKTISFIKEDKDVRLNYDHLIFATDPVTPSKLIKDFKDDIVLDEIGTSGKVTAFLKIL